MGFGAVLASGDDNVVLPEELMACVTEVRVEQFLDRPTEFAVRFQEDLSGGEPRVMKSDELQAERRFSIAVPDKKGLKCLVRGPITECKCSFQLGGPGSWFEIHGQDRRVEMDRECIRFPWKVRASEAAQTILSNYQFKPSIQSTTRVYSEKDVTLNQRGTDLSFLNRIACQNNLCFWIEYSCDRSGLDPTRARLKIRETANLKSSPPRPVDSPGPPPSPADAILVANTDLRLRVNVEPSQCQNVTAFEMEQRTENPKKFDGRALSDRDLRSDLVTAEDRQPLIRQGGVGLRGLTRKDRVICFASPGDQKDMQPRAESAMTQAGWFLNASADTTAHMLGGVLVPHDVIEVDGLGRRHSGAFQIEAVTHVVNAADHHMNLSLRRNAVGRT